MMISYILTAISFMFSLAVAGGDVSDAKEGNLTPQQRYVDRYARLAVEEMYRSGVPASITLAQGLLESGYGLSELAVKGNNHFGIKCHNSWTGAKMYHDDDSKGECFRKYDSVEESFRDHSDFLRYRDRYKFLFDLETADYKSWAHGLKKAGYATDPSYPAKLISIIENYELYRYDTGLPSGETAADISDQYAGKTKPTRNDRKHKKDKETVVPQSPHMIEQVQPYDKSSLERFHFSLTRQLYSQNGVPFVYAIAGETYKTIAALYDLFPAEILKFNDASEDSELLPGTVVYLQAKKKKTPKGLDKHVIDGKESLRDIAQRYGVKLSTLIKINDLPSDYNLKEGDIIKLRK